MSFLLIKYSGLAVILFDMLNMFFHCLWTLIVTPLSILSFQLLAAFKTQAWSLFYHQYTQEHFSFYLFYSGFAYFLFYLYQNNIYKEDESPLLDAHIYGFMGTYAFLFVNGTI